MTAIAVEAMGPTWAFVDALMPSGAAVSLVDPRKTRLKAGYAAKTDRLDARRLADSTVVRDAKHRPPTAAHAGEAALRRCRPREVKHGFPCASFLLGINSLLGNVCRTLEVEAVSIGVSERGDPQVVADKRLRRLEPSCS